MTNQPISQRKRLFPRIDKRWINTGLHLLLVLTVVSGFVALWWFDRLPERVDDQQTVVVGQARYAPDSEASVRVVVQDFARGEPVAGARVKVSLKPASGAYISLYEGETDETGSAPVSFHVPADVEGEATLVVETASAAGQDRVEQPVTIEREYRVLLSSDKPLYQPGQTIHMRALALSAFDLRAADGASVGFLVEDPKGNKVFRQEVTASAFGVAAADFRLADLVNQGDYKLSACVSGLSPEPACSEKTVEVRPYVLPKFGVVVTTERTYYLPGERVEGVVQADYFFGKPVDGGEVRIVGSVWDVERFVVVDLRGETDENGAYPFSFDLPDYFAGSGLESGQAQFALEVTVIDQAEHAEETSAVLPIAAQPLVIEAVAESGVLKPGVENIVYILTSYPDGRPAPAKLAVRVDSGAPVELETGAYGLAEFTFTPTGSAEYVLDISAWDGAGRQAARRVYLLGEYGSDSVLLRADRAAYVVGETMALVALTPVDSGSVYLDIVKGGQTLSTRSARVTGGKAEFVVDVSPDLYGTLELHAYKVLLDGTVVRDTRIVVVDAPHAVDIAIEADKETYLPGETAVLDFQTSDTEAGTGVQTVLGLAVVDESVFALQQQDPGFAKLYFLLTQELMEPFYQVKGFEFPAQIPPDEVEVRTAQDGAAKAAWAGVAGGAVSAANSRLEKQMAAAVAQSAGFRGVGDFAAVGLILVPAALVAVAVVALVRSGVVKRALVRAGVTLGIVVVAEFLLTGWLVALMNWAYYLDLEVVLIALLALLGLGLLAFIIYAWVRRDTEAKFITLLTLAWPALILLLILVSNRDVDLDETLVLLGLLAALFVPAAYLFFGQVRWAQRRRVGGGLATALGVCAALPTMAVLSVLFIFVTSAPMLMGTVTGGAPPEGIMARATEAPMAVEGEKDMAEPIPVTGGPGPAGEAPRLRQYFPETLYWAPEVVTDEGGFVSLQVPMADSITTWRLTALASTQDGRLGFTTQGIRVFQDFFVDVDLPVALTQGDEIGIPVGVYNYLPQAQEVRLEVQEENWFELLGDKEQTLTVAANDVEVVYFPIRVVAFGRQGFQVTAWGAQMSDAVRREVTVVPDGKEMRLTESDWLREDADRDGPLEVALDIPVGAVPDTPHVEVKIYPGVMAQAVEGLEKILRMPHG